MRYLTFEIPSKVLSSFARVLIRSKESVRFVILFIEEDCKSLRALFTKTNNVSTKYVMFTNTKIICNWFVKFSTAKCHPIVIPPANTGSDKSSKNAVIKIAQTNRGNL